MPKYDEVSIIQRAYNELLALDQEGQIRALDWLRARITSDHLKVQALREEGARERLARRATPGERDE